MNDVQVQQMWKGTIIVSATVILLKLLGALQKIPLQNIAGDRVYGIYNAVYPIYQFMFGIIATGIPVAISLIIAEQYANKHYHAMNRTVWVSSLMLLGLCLVLSLFLWLNAPYIAVLIGDSATVIAVKVVAISLLVIPLMAVFRGYFQGLNDILPASFSQLIEQLIRVIFILGVLFIGYSMIAEEAAVAAYILSGSIFGGIFALLFLSILYFVRRYRERESNVAVPEQAIPFRKRNLVRRIIMTAIPVTLGALTVPLLSLVDSLTVVRLLQAGSQRLEEAEAMVQFGLYSRAQPLVQLVIMIAGAIGAVIAPVITASRVKGETAKVRAFIALILRGAWWLGCAASMGLLMLGKHINIAFFTNDEASLTFSLVGATALAGAVIALSSAILQGTGNLLVPVYAMVIAAVMKLVLNYVLVPRYGIEGAAVSAIVALSVAAIILAVVASRFARQRSSKPAHRLNTLINANRAQLNRPHLEWQGSGHANQVTPRAWRLLVTLTAMAVTIGLVEVVATLLTSGQIETRPIALLISLIGTVTGAIIFVIVGLRLRAVSRDDILSFPNGEHLYTFLMKNRLIVP